MNDTRKKQPESVQRALLDSAAKIAADVGVPGLTIQAVAEAAGVTKGGLLHHFASKQALLDGMIVALLTKLDAEIDAYMAEDPSSYGRFTRAYVKATFSGKAFGFETPWSMLFMAVITDPALRHHWVRWLDGKLAQYETSDADDHLQIVRLAADGTWLSYVTAGSKAGPLDFNALGERLLALTRVRK
jgi:AcrR family transcriptional regulator